MSVHLEWVVPGRVLYVRLSGTPSLNLLEYGFMRLQRLMEAQAPVHILIDLRDVTRYPGNILRLQRAGAAYFRHTNASRTVFLMNNWLHRYTLGVLWHDYQSQWHMFDGAAPALRFLRSVDSRLPAMTLPDDAAG